MSELHDLARRLATWDLPCDAVGMRTFDTLAALVAGSMTEEGRALAASLRGFDDGLPGTVTRRVATARLTELDDIHMPSCTTPGAVVVPTAITLAQSLKVDRAVYRRAVVIGYEAMTRLGSAIDGASIVYRGVWPTYFCAPFAAAALSASLLDLDAIRLANALGIALTRASGLSSEVTGMPIGRWLTIGEAARSGCAAAFAARDGFVADVDLDRIATGAGFAFHADALNVDLPAAIDEVSVKPFPIAKQCLAAVQAALRLRDLAALGPVRVHVPGAYAQMIGTQARPESRLSRLSSARWNLTLALYRPEELHDLERSLSPDDPQLSRLADGIEIVEDRELSRLYPFRWPARVEMSGRSETVIDAIGDPPQQNDLASIDRKWQQRPEELQALREASLSTDLSRLNALLDSRRDDP
ncbi:MAG: MmgE/PrpD family protein [Acidimicrobiales bacterium]